MQLADVLLKRRSWAFGRAQAQIHAQGRARPSSAADRRLHSLWQAMLRVPGLRDRCR